MKKPSSFFFMLACVYLGGHFWFLLNPGIFWDDWVWFDNLSETRKGMHELGFGPVVAPFMIFTHETTDKILLYKSIVFLLNMGSVLIFRRILDSFKALSTWDKNALSICFALCPLVMARSSLCVANNALTWCLFSIATLLVVQRTRVQYRLLTFLSLPFFYFSYFTNSFVPFMAVVYVVEFLRLEKKGQSWRDVIFLYLRQNLVLILLPIFFWGVKKIYYVPYGFYENYNSFEFRGMKTLVSDFYMGLRAGFFEPLFFSLGISGSVTIFLAVCVMIFGYHIWKNRGFGQTLSRDVSLFLLGGVFFLIAIFPYIVVGKIPFFTPFESRHQLLLPLGFSFLLVFGIKIILARMPRRSVTIVFAVIMVLFNLALFRQYMLFQKMHFRQEAFMHEFKTNSLYTKYKMFFVKDHFVELGWLCFYDYSGMFYKVFGEQSRLAENDLNQLKTISQWNELARRRYKLADFVYRDNEPLLKVSIVPSHKYNEFETLQMLVSSYLDHDKYMQQLALMASFSYEEP